MIRNININDAKEVADIYNYYVRNTIITFEEQDLSMSEMQNRIKAQKESLPWIVCEENDRVIAYASASRWKSRCAYRLSVESSIYIRHTEHGRGLGTVLYTELLNRLRHSDAHAIIAGISLPNEASVALHEKLGFTKVAHFREVGFKFGQYIDVGYWELVL